MVDRTDPRPAILISGRNEEARAIVCAEVERRYSDDYPVAGATSPEAGREELRRLAGEGEVAAVLTTLDDHDSDAFDFLAGARRISPANLPRDRDPLGEVGNGIGHLRSAGRRGHGLLSHFTPAAPRRGVPRALMSTSPPTSCATRAISRSPTLHAVGGAAHH